MQITFIMPPVSLGGGTRVVVIYAQWLQRMGHSVKVVSPPPRPLPLRQRIKSWLKSGPSQLSSEKSHFDGSGIDHHILETWRPVSDSDVPDADVVIATWWETAEWVTALSPSKGAKAYFIQHHEVFPPLPVERSRATYKMPLHKIVIARWLKDVMRNEYGDDVVDLVPNSVDRTQFFAPVRGMQAVPTVGFLYSRSAYKGTDVTDAAIQMVRKQRPDLHLIGFGSGRPIPAWPLPEGTEYFFCPAQDQIRNIYARCDVWLTASKSEGFNLPPLEAMACRTPVVSTRTGWPEEAVQTGWNGVLVDVDDVAGLAKGVEWLLSRSDEEWRAVSANAYATAIKGSWQDSAKLFERALERACQRAARGEIGGRSSEEVRAKMLEAT